MVKVTVRDQCGMDVVYSQLSNWSCLQWTLHS